MPSPVSVKDLERATDLYQARYAIIHWGWSRSYGLSRSSSLYLFTPRMNYPFFRGIDLINTDRPEMIFESIPLSVQELVAVLRKITELHDR